MPTTLSTPPQVRQNSVTRLRSLHEEMDQAVAAAYGSSDLDLGHGFHATKQGERNTLSKPSLRTVFNLGPDK